MQELAVMWRPEAGHRGGSSCNKMPTFTDVGGDYHCRGDRHLPNEMDEETERLPPSPLDYPCVSFARPWRYTRGPALVPVLL